MGGVGELRLNGWKAWGQLVGVSGVSHCHAGPRF
jgi:hypothetical protein